MAQRTVIQLTDDLDGKPIDDGKGETVTFAIDGTDYEIDLGDKNAAGLRDVFAKYVGAARKVSSRSAGSRGRTSTASRSKASANRDYDPSEVREWAKAHGIDVNDRGRVPSSLVLQFQEANK
jgi:Lsr2